MFLAPSTRYIYIYIYIYLASPGFEFFVCRSLKITYIFKLNRRLEQNNLNRRRLLELESG